MALAQMVYGKEPMRISTMANIGETGVDEQSSIIFGYDNNAMVVLTCGIRIDTVNEARIYGTKGSIRIPHKFWWRPNRIIVKLEEDEEKEIAFKQLGNDYTYEVIEVMQRLKENKTESEIMDFNTSIAIMSTMDRIRKQWNLVYPEE
ncbi:MAG: hypothetical protein ABID32_02425 [Candidatus Omnitrophota bacterium]|nr:hypothetical protein [Candidatus Omnitrophota bacterium]